MKIYGNLGWTKLGNDKYKSLKIIPLNWAQEKGLKSSYVSIQVDKWIAKEKGN